MKTISFGTLNVRGCQKELEKQTLAADAADYQIDILGVSETHIKVPQNGKTKGKEEEIIIRKENKNITYRFYQCQTWRWIAIT